MRIKFNEKTFIVILLILLFVSVTFSSIQSYRLERLRQQYYKVGVQLEAARNRQQSIRDNVERTGALGHFKIKKEEASSAGVRRIKAVLK